MFEHLPYPSLQDKELYKAEILNQVQKDLEPIINDLCETCLNKIKDFKWIK